MIETDTSFAFCAHASSTASLKTVYSRQIVYYCVSFVLLKLILFLNDFIHFFKVLFNLVLFWVLCLPFVLYPWIFQVSTSMAFSFFFFFLLSQLYVAHYFHVSISDIGFSNFLPKPGGFDCQIDREHSKVLFTRNCRGCSVF